MGNLGFLVPTKNKGIFKPREVHTLLMRNFPKLTFNRHKEANSIQVMYKDMFVMDLFFNQKCYILNFEEDIKELREMFIVNPELGEELATKLETLESLNPDLDNCIVTNKSGFDLERNQIESYLKDFFGLYIFDEGIHPEYIPPDYVYKFHDYRSLKFLNKTTSMKKIAFWVIAIILGYFVVKALFWAFHIIFTLLIWAAMAGLIYLAIRALARKL